MPADLEATRKLLASLWEKSRPLTEQRLTLLHSVAEAASDGTLTADARQTAAGEAHKLTGSLGMFGFPEGSVIARQMEQHLDGSAAADGPRIADWVAALRRELSL